MVFPTTPLPAAKIGEDYTVMLNGVPVSTLSTFIRNLAPGSAAGIPGLSLPAGMTKAGLPVGMAIDAPEKSDHQLLAIGLALETVLPELPAPPAWEIARDTSGTARQTARGDVSRIVPIRADPRELRRALDDIATISRPKKP